MLSDGWLSPLLCCWDSEAIVRLIDYLSLNPREAGGRYFFGSKEKTRKITENQGWHNRVHCVLYVTIKLTCSNGIGCHVT